MAVTPPERESIARVLDVLEAERLATSGTATAVLWGDLAAALADDDGAVA